MNESDCLLEKGIDGVTKLKRNLKKISHRKRTRFNWTKKSVQHGDEHSGSLDQINDYQLLRDIYVHYLTIEGSVTVTNLSIRQFTPRQSSLLPKPVTPTRRLF